MSWDKIDHMLLKFNFTFTWNYGGDGELRSLLPDVFRVLDEDDERSLEQLLIGCVHQANPGLTLCQPKDNPDIPYEMKFIVHPPHESFCITKIVLLSEARNLELYVNGGYEKSTRGIMLTLNKERKLSVFEAQFDLSAYIDSKSNATIKFLSHSCKDHMKLKAVVIKVEKCKPIASIQDDQLGGAVNLSSVKRYLGSVGRPLSDDAQKMLQSIENYQKSPAFKAQQMLSSQAALLQNISQARPGTEVARDTATLPEQDEKEVSDEVKARLETSQPEQDEPFMNMLSEMGLKDKLNSEQKTSMTQDASSRPQARWAAYLQSRVRASQSMSPKSSAEVPRSMSFDRHEGVREDTRETGIRQRHSSDSCVGDKGRDRSFNPEQLRQKWLEEGGHSPRCETCGCPGCISVFNSISANIFAAEKRILEKVDDQFRQLRVDLDSKFQLLYQLLDKKIVIDDEED